MIAVMRRLLGLCLCSAGLLLAGADISGIWTGNVQGRNGETQEITFRFQQDGDTFTGKIYGENEDTPLSDGKISGDRISFTVTSEFGSGRGKYVYTGTIQGSSLELTRDRDGSRSGNSGGERRNYRQTFTLKRMLGR
jgi:hypothetical protein